MKFVGGVSTDAKVIALTGSSDTNTTPATARVYIDALKARGVDATMTLVPGARHGFGSGLDVAARKIIIGEM